MDEVVTLTKEQLEKIIDELTFLKADITAFVLPRNRQVFDNLTERVDKVIALLPSEE